MNKLATAPTRFSTPSMHKDHRYIQALLNGDSRLIGEIYSQSAPTIINWVRQNGGNDADAKDVMQDALLAIARQARNPGWQLTCPFGAFLFLVCKRKWFNELKRRNRAGVTMLDLDGLEGEMASAKLVATVMEEEEKHKLFWQKFGTLGQGCQRLLKLAWSGKPLEEVATELGVSYGYVRKKKCNCIARLTELVQNDPKFKKMV